MEKIIIPIFIHLNYLMHRIHCHAYYTNITAGQQCKSTDSCSH